MLNQEFLNKRRQFIIKNLKILSSEMKCGMTFSKGGKNLKSLMEFLSNDKIEAETDLNNIIFLLNEQKNVRKKAEELKINTDIDKAVLTHSFLKDCQRNIEGDQINLEIVEKHITYNKEFFNKKIYKSLTNDNSNTHIKSLKVK